MISMGGARICFFLKLVCNTEGFPSKGRGLLNPLKVVWDKTQPGSSAARYNSQALLSKFSVSLLLGAGKLLNINNVHNG